MASHCESGTTISIPSQKDIKAILSKLTNLEEIVWTQEEPQNMGAGIH
ncbi:hypothetical protein ACEQPO_16365 [Bacillus sp. SL00103]